MKQNKINKPDKLDFIKIKKFCASKDIIKKVKREPMEQRKIFANHITDKGLASRVKNKEVL